MTTVADTSLMLALMAGRNARESMTVVNEGKVRPPSSLTLPNAQTTPYPKVARI